MFRVWYTGVNNNIPGRWIENIPATEALVFKEEGYRVQRMDLPFTTPPYA